MPTYISSGSPFVMAQNVIYATPVRRKVSGYVSPATAVLQGNAVNSATGMTAITVGADGQFSNMAPFIRCTDASGCTISFGSE